MARRGHRWSRTGTAVSDGHPALNSALHITICVVIFNKLLGAAAGVQNLPFLMHKAHQTVRVVKQGMALAFATLAVTSVLACLGAIPLYVTI